MIFLAAAPGGSFSCHPLHRYIMGACYLSRHAPPVQRPLWAAVRRAML